MEAKEYAAPVEPSEVDSQAVRDPFDDVIWRADANISSVNITTADDYYILFRDPTPFDFERRCWQEDPPLRFSDFRKRLQEKLIIDQASFVWRYAGKLTEPQATEVQKRIGVVFKEKFNSPSCASKNLSSESVMRRDLHLGLTGAADTLWVVPHQPEALTFLAQKSPKLDYLSKLPVNHCVRIRLEFEKESPLESEIERLRLQEELFQRASQYDATFSFYTEKYEKNSALYEESFIRLVPLFALWSFLERIDDDCSKVHSCASNMNTLRLMAAIWSTEAPFSEHFEDDTDLDTVEKTVSIKAFFNTFIPTQTPTPFQQEVLDECVDIANSVREEEDCKKWNIESKYVVTLAETPTTDQKSKLVYEECVKILIEARARNVICGLEKGLFTVKEMVSLLKESDMFEDSVVPKDSEIAKSITQTQAWKDRKDYFAFLQKSAVKPIRFPQQQVAIDRDVLVKAIKIYQDSSERVDALPNVNIDGINSAVQKAIREHAEAMLDPVLKKLQAIEVAVNKKNVDRENDAAETESTNDAKATKPKSKSAQPKIPKEISDNSESRTIYSDGVEEFLRGLVKAYKDGTMELDVIDKSLRNSDLVSGFLAARPEFRDKKNPTRARSIASALDHGRCIEWTNRHDIWKEINGSPPSRLHKIWDQKPANKIQDEEDGNNTKAGSRSPHPNSRPGFNVVETGRIECNSAVEDYFLELNTRLDSGEIDYTQYRTLFDELTPLDVAEWIKENFPEFKDKGIEPLKNGVEYSVPWREKRNFRLPTPSSHKK